MDSKTYGIGILTLTATALLLANLFAPSPAIGEEAIGNSDMQAVTARTVKGGDALYLLDNDSGRLAVFVVDPRNGLQLLTVEDVEVGFRRPAGGGNGKR
jgi:hypothetical protein